MACVHLPEFVVNIASAEDDIKKLFKSVKPEWNQDGIIVKNMSGGFSCLSSCVYMEDNPDDAFTVRVRKLFAPSEIGENDNFQITDTKFEIKVVQELSKIGVFSSIHAVFQNGYCYRYLTGKPMVYFDKNTKTKPEIDRDDIKMMMEKLAEIHSIKLKNEDYTKTNFFAKYDKILQMVYPEGLELVDKTTLLKEYHEILKYSEQFDLPVVFCHGDPHTGNVVIDKDKGQMTFVDWELAHIGYQAYDVAYCVRMLHFGDIMELPMILETNKDQKPEVPKRQIMKWYFDKWSELNLVNSNDESFEEFYRQVVYFGLVWCLVFNITFGQMFANMKADVMGEMPVDPKGIMHCVYNYYCRIKEKTLRDLNLQKIEIEIE